MSSRVPDAAQSDKLRIEQNPPGRTKNIQLSVSTPSLVFAVSPRRTGRS
jgi:hypothetical protein